MKLFKAASFIIVTAIISSTASAFWWGESTDTNGPYKVVKYSTDHSCADLKAIVAEEGAAVIYESANPPLYKKYVNSGNYCDGHEMMYPDWIMAKDGKCLLSECVPHSGGDN